MPDPNRPKFDTNTGQPIIYQDEPQQGTGDSPDDLSFIYDGSLDPQLPPSTAHGTAKLIVGGEDDLTPLFERSRYDLTAVPLGINDTGQSTGMVWDLLRQKGMACTFGSTRCGKGVNSIIPALLTYGAGSMVVLDPKGENAWITAERRREMGQRVVILDPWGEVNRKWASKFNESEVLTNFNPFSILDPDDLDFSEEIAILADAIVIESTGTGSNSDHWNASAKELIGGLIAAAVEASPRRASIRDVLDLLTSGDDELSKAIAALCKDRPDSLAARKLRRFSKSNSENSSIRSTAETQMAVFYSGHLQKHMETGAPPFDLSEICTQRVTVYLVLPVDKLETHGRWLRMVISLMLHVIGKQARQPRFPVLFMLDEFGTIGKLQAIETAYGLLAGLNVRIWAFLQGLDQLQRWYPNSWQTFIGNSSVIQVLNARNDDTADWVSKYLGVGTVEEKTGEVLKKVRWKPDNYQKVVASYTKHIMQNGLPHEISGISAPGSYGPTFVNANAAKVWAIKWLNKEGIGDGPQIWTDDKHWISRELMKPDEVIRLPETESLVILPGFNPHRINRVSYFQEPRWAGWYRDPYTYRRAATA